MTAVSPLFDRVQSAAGVVRSRSRIAPEIGIILGTGLGARPIFNTDVFCFVHPASRVPMRPTMLPPETIIQGVRKGVQDGGNKSGIPTVNGAVYFDDRYLANPLVFCGCAGLIPRNKIHKETQSGDARPTKG